MEFKQSKTYENIVNAYKGELSGVVLYNCLSKKVKDEGKSELAELFVQLAKEEQGHANTFARFMEDNLEQYALSKAEIEKLELSLDNPLEKLTAFIAGEKQAGNEIYPGFAKIAAEENFTNVADTFSALAKAELRHGEILESQLAKL